MSHTLRIAFRNLSIPIRSDILRICTPLSPQPIRFLYAKSTLGLDGFQEQKKQIKGQMHNIEEKFRERMKTFVAEDAKSMIFTEDLKNMCYLAENDADIDLVVEMAKKFNSQNKELRFGSFIFGPVLMRMFYLHEKPNEALECFKLPELEGLFDQLITYQILLDLLYENGKYQEILDVFELIKSKQLQGAKYPRNSVVLVMAACYKMNSSESLQYALNLWNELIAAGHFLMRRATTFCAGLALNQGKPGVALEIISTVRKASYTTIRNIKARAFSELGRLDDAIELLKSILSEDQPVEVRQTFNRDVMECVKSAVAKEENAELSLEFNRLEKLFEKEGHITETTLDAQLCSEIQKPPVMNNRQLNTYSRFNNQDQNRRNFDTRRRLPQRPGLKELV